MQNQLFDAITQVLQQAGAPIDAAEVHGMLCGFLCIGKNRDDNLWLNRIVDEGECDTAQQGLSDKARQILLSLKNYTHEQLTSDECGLELLLPDDDDGMDIRSSALANWCAGFLFGASAGGLGDVRQLPPDAKEFVADVTHFARITPENLGDEDDETLEKAYAELVEYLRVGMLTLHQEQTLQNIQENQ